MTLRLVMKCVALCAVLTAGGAHALVFSYSGHGQNDDSSGRYDICRGELLGVTYRVVEACRPRPYGLGAASYVVATSGLCQPCELLGDMCTSTAETEAAMAEVTLRLLLPHMAPYVRRRLNAYLLSIFVDRCESART